ncbi:class I SAM-dependent methyltransferase [Sulfurifustis variabilis]|nr:class I SAM-dependent methyltransferase [Sulfurifustis variabilis]
MKGETVPIINQIEDMVRGVPGWTPIDQLYTLFNLVCLTSDLPGDILEIGSWCGRSSAVLGFAARLSGEARVMCVDLFPGKTDWKQNPDGSYSFRVAIAGKTYGGYQEQTVWKEPFERDIAPIYARYDSVFDVFSDTIRRQGLQERVEAFRGNSETFADQAPPGFRCRVAFIDGDHSYEAVCRDIRNVERFLVPGGWVCFDDAFSHYEGVNRAITDLVIKNPDYALGQQMTRKLFIARRKPVAA